MNDVTIALSVIILFGALPCIVGGYLIAVKQKRSLISGWDESKISNPAAYARLIGYSLLLLGCLIAIIAGIWYQGWVDEKGMTVGLLLASLIPIPAIILANRKYK